MDYIRSAHPAISFTAGAATVALLSLVYSTSSASKRTSNVYKAPIDDQEWTQDPSLPYPSTSVIGGARDVPTPYGNIRVYEFGSADATRKILFLHGISTPSVALVGIAENLAAKGCRVMLMDLFGRGWSSGPNDLVYDNRLYMTQVLLAIASSPISWTGHDTKGGFSLVGYSMGGGVAADFTSWFPELVEDLVLIAPAGLLRENHITSQSKFLYSQGILPDSLRQSLIKRRLKAAPIVSTKVKGSKTLEPHPKADSTSSVVSAENPKDLPAQSARGNVDTAAVVAWQLDHHPAFLPAFISSIQNAPIHDQHQRWALIRSRLDQQREAEGHAERSTEDEQAIKRGLKTGKVFMALGTEDKIVISSEVEQDAKAVLGEDNVKVEMFPAGHEIPISCATGIAEAIWETWQKGGRSS